MVGVIDAETAEKSITPSGYLITKIKRKLSLKDGDQIIPIIIGSMT